MIASKAARGLIRFGPRFGGSCSARIGSITAHNSSEASQIGGSGSRSFFGLPIMPPTGEAHRLDRGSRCPQWRMNGRWSNLGSQSGPMGAKTMGNAYFEWLSQAPPVVQVNHLISGGWIAQAVGVAAELGIADLLADG